MPDDALGVTRNQRDFTGDAQGLTELASQPEGDDPCCYANSRLLPSQRYRWVQPHWRRLRPRPGARMVAGTVVGMAATAGVRRACMSAVPPTVTAAAMCGNWCRPPGDRAGA